MEYLVNKFFEMGAFPLCFKTAKVKPIEKMKGNCDISNYRLISLLSAFSKVVKKLMHKRLTNFLNKNNILSHHQFGFRDQHSMELAIVELIHRIGIEAQK